MAVDVADFQRCKNRLVSLLNLDDEDSPYTGVVAEFGEYQDDEIEDALFEGDTLFVEAILNSATHPFRNQFISGTPSTLVSGDKVPVYMGVSDKVECKLTDNTWVLGKQARNQSRFQAIVDGSDVASTMKQRYYYREGGRIYTAGTGVRVYSPTFNQDRSAPFTLQSPVQYERGVIGWAMFGLWKGTTNQQVHDFYGRQSQSMLQMAAKGATHLPEIELFRRRDG